MRPVHHLDKSTSGRPNGGSKDTAGGLSKKLYQTVVKQHFSNKILGWIIDLNSKTG